MSHLAKIELIIKNLDALKQACRDLGFIYDPNLTSFKSYYGDNPCHSAIRIVGCDYEIGVIKENDNTYSLHWDSWHEGGLTPVIGLNAGVIKQAYTIEAVKREAKLKKYRVTQKKIKKGIRLVLAA